MRHLGAVAARPPSAKAEDLGLAARIKAPADRRKVRVVPLTADREDPADLVDPLTADRVDPADLVDQETSGVLVAQVDLATTADREDPADLVDPLTADPADPVVQVTSAGLAVPVTSGDLVVQETSGRDLPMRSEASTVSHGAMEQRRGAGEHPRVPGGAGRSLPRAECGTKGRSTTGASKNNRFGIGTKTVGASGSSESGSRCNERVTGRAVAPHLRSGRPPVSAGRLAFHPALAASSSGRW
jgi:hypothetical protein